METIVLDGDAYRVAPAGVDWSAAERWVAADDDGRWTLADGAVVGEWLRASPSLFLREPLAGDVLARMRVTLLPTDDAFAARYRASRWADDGGGPGKAYNVNVWLRATAPGGGDLLGEYRDHLGTGANGMGDERWRSWFCTVVRNPAAAWIRLRRGPGYEKVRDVPDAAPPVACDRPFELAFALVGGRVRAYLDGRRLYDYADPEPITAGRFGLCVWVTRARFDRIRIDPIR